MKVLYVGDAGVLVGPLFLGSPFLMELKGLDVKIWGQPLIDALQSDPEIKVIHMPAWTAYRDFPRTPKDLSEYAVIILSDVEAESLYFYPEFYTPSEWTKSLAFPNRLKSIMEFVERGGGLVMAGSWATFSGRHGHSGWKGTPVEEVLPVSILEGDDRVETPEGAKIRATDNNHPVMSGIPWETAPKFLGYNKTILKSNSTLLATVGEEDDPLIAVKEHGKGRTMAFTSDPCPHWGINFLKWEHYGRFWLQAIKWLAREK